MSTHFDVTDLPIRFQEKISIDTVSGCWEWTSGHFNSGYGRVRDGGKNRVAHRVTYTLLVGPIPDGLVIDHLCRNRACVNPSHLEPVTHKENIRRGVGVAGVNFTKTHCIHGHPFDEANTKHVAGRRRCRACDHAKYVRRQSRRAEARRIRDEQAHVGQLVDAKAVPA